MKRSDFRKANEVMGKLSQIHARGEEDFSNMYGSDNMDGDDSDNYEDDSFEYGESNMTGGRGRGRGTNFEPAQTDIRFFIQNNIGTAATTILPAAYPSLQVTLFGANKNSLSYIRALGLLSTGNTTPTLLGIEIDGTLVAGTTNGTNVDLEVGSDTTTYGQIFSDTSINPMQAKVLRLNNSNSTQLNSSFTITTTNNLGAITSNPYTASSKKSANQYDPTIIDDQNFNIRMDGNTIISYNLFSAGQGGTTASVANQQYFTMHLYRQVDVARSIGGKGAIRQARGFQVPGQTLRIAK